MKESKFKVGQYVTVTDQYARILPSDAAYVGQTFKIRLVRFLSDHTAYYVFDNKTLWSEIHLESTSKEILRLI